MSTNLVENVRVISTDGRLFQGKLEGFDNSTNIVISGCIEIVVKSSEEEFQQLEMGVYLLRGTNIVCIGEVEGEVNWTNIEGDKLKGTKNPL